MRIFIISCVAFLVVVLSGCTPVSPAKPVQLDTAGVEPSADVADLKLVLKKAVTENGYLKLDDFPAVAKSLEQQLKLLAVTGPDATPKLYPTAADRLAYWYNARMAWSIKLAVLRHKQKADNPASLGTKAFPLDGKQMTLAKIDALLEKQFGSSAVIAAPGMDLRRAALPQTVFIPKTVQKQIPKRFAAFVVAPDRFIVDVETQTVRFPPVIWKFRRNILDKYIKQYGKVQPTLTTALLPHVKGSAIRRLQNAIGYKCAEDNQSGKLAIIE